MKKLIFLILVLSLSSCRSVYTVCPAGCDYSNLQNNLTSLRLSEKDIVEIKSDNIDGTTFVSELKEKNCEDILNTNPMMIRLKSGDVIILSQNYKRK